jgi:hypothetical protein
MGIALHLGALRQVVTLSQPGSPVPDGDGGFTHPYTPLDPVTWRCAIAPPKTPRPSETTAAGTVTAHATHVLTGRFHPGITSQTRFVWTDTAGAVHTADALDVDDTEGLGIETVALVTEIAP